jgi:hypothetical protein
MFLSFHRKDILFAICALFCDFIDDHFPGRTGSYIEYNRRSRTFVQYYCPANCLNVKFHIASKIREGAHGWRRQIAKCHKYFSAIGFRSTLLLRRLVGMSHRESRRRRGIIEKYPAAEGKNASACIFQRRNFFLAVRSRGTLNVRIGKKVTRRNFVPQRPQDGHLQRSRIKNLKHPRLIPRMYEKFFLRPPQNVKARVRLHAR